MLNILSIEELSSPFAVVGELFPRVLALVLQTLSSVDLASLVLGSYSCENRFTQEIEQEVMILDRK